MPQGSTASEHFRREFIDGLVHKFQNEGFALRGYTKAPSKVTAETAQWDVLGTMVATKKVRNSDATLQNPTHTKVEAIMEEWEVYFQVEQWDLDRMAHNLKEEYKQKAAWALGERYDINILGELNTGAQSGVGAPDYINGAGANPITLQNVAEAAAKGVDERKWPKQLRRVYFCSALQFEYFKGYKQFNNADYTGPKLAYVDPSMARTWNGIDFVSLSRQYFPTNAASTHDEFLMLQDSVGYAYNFDNIQDWWGTIPRRRAWECNLAMNGKAKTLLPEGIYRFRAPDAFTMAFN